MTTPFGEWFQQLHAQALDWVARGGAASAVSATARTPAYVDLIFAFGLASVGEAEAARRLLHGAEHVLSPLDDAHTFLLGAYRYRIARALEGAAFAGPLPDELGEHLNQMDVLCYAVDRLRKHSSILEPDQRTNPYRHWGARISDFEKALAELTDITDRNELTTRIDKLLATVPKGAKGVEDRARVLRAGLEASPRISEDFARRMLEHSLPAYDALPEPKETVALMEQAHFLEKALFVAGHFGRIEHMHPLVARFQRMLSTQKGPAAYSSLDLLAGSCFRGLRKLGMRDEIDTLLRQLADLVLEGQDVKNVDFEKQPHGPAAMRVLLHVASGWYYFGRDTQADPILQSARGVLLAGDLPAREQTDLAKSYAKAVGQAPVEVAQKRLEEVFESLKGIKDTYTTSTHFSVSQLDVVEAVVLAALEVARRPD